LERVELTMEEVVEQVRREDDPRAHLVQLLLLAVVVLAPGEHDAQHDEREHGDEPDDREPPPKRRGAAPERRFEAAVAFVRRERAPGRPSAALDRWSGGGRSAAWTSCTTDTTCASPMMSKTRRASRLGAATTPVPPWASISRTDCTSVLTPLE